VLESWDPPFALMDIRDDAGLCTCLARSPGYGVLPPFVSSLAVYTSLWLRLVLISRPFEESLPGAKAGWYVLTGDAALDGAGVARGAAGNDGDTARRATGGERAQRTALHYDAPGSWYSGRGDARPLRRLSPAPWLQAAATDAN